MSLEIGARLGAYEIVAKIGEGGMGQVFRARDTKLDRDVAIKVLPEAFALDAERLARFEREAKVLASLNHPNIAAIYGLEEAGGSRALVMELVEGPTLGERIAAGKLPVAETIAIARQLADALADAHARGIIHRDLKPANIKLTVGGKVKVLDFGLAKAMANDPSSMTGAPLSDSPTLTFAATEAGIILGTAAYMSPEQARGQAVDRRADIWAFGVLIDEMLTGERRFASATVSDTLAAVLREEITWHRLPPGTPRPLRRLLRRCLERDPENRLHDLADARLELDDALADRAEPEVEAAPAAPKRAVPLSALVGGLVLGALVGAALAYLIRPAATPPEPVRIRQLTFSGQDFHPAVSPDGRLVAYTSTVGGVPQIWLRQFAGGGQQRLTEGPDIRPRFARDGSSLLFLRKLGDSFSLYRTPLVGGEPRRLVDGINEADWSPDGGRIAMLRGSLAQDELLVLDLASGTTRSLLSVSNWILPAVRWSPDGRTIAVVQGSTLGATGGFKILLIDPESGSSREVGGTGSTTLSALHWTRDSGALVYAIAPNTVGDLSGIPSRVVLHRLDGSAPRTLFWSNGLFPFRGNDASTSRFDSPGPGRLVFETYEQREALAEFEIGAAARGRQLTRSSATDRQPAYSPDGRQVVFSSNRSGNLDLWIVDLATGDLRQLTDDAAQDWDPGFTPDGKSVLFSSDRSGNLEIWIANADGSAPRQVTRDGVDAENPTMTADGRWIVYSTGNPEHQGVTRIAPDGSGERTLAPGSFTNPEVSPDGRFALYVDNDSTRLHSTLYVVNVESGEHVGPDIEVPYQPMAPNVTYGRGRWLPDGSAIAFVCLNAAARTGICVQDFAPGRDTAATRRELIGFFDSEQVESFGISPDGKRITLATMREVRALQLAENVPEVD